MERSSVGWSRRSETVLVLKIASGLSLAEQRLPLGPLRVLTPVRELASSDDGVGATKASGTTFLGPFRNSSVITI